MIRYRRPSLKTALGLTKTKRQIKKDLGVYEVTKVTNAPKNAKRKAKRAMGWESGPAKFFRFLRGLFR
jgi:hypothetical protein